MLGNVINKGLRNLWRKLVSLLQTFKTVWCLVLSAPMEHTSCKTNQPNEIGKLLSICCVRLIFKWIYLHGVWRMAYCIWLNSTTMHFFSFAWNRAHRWIHINVTRLSISVEKLLDNGLTTFISPYQPHTIHAPATHLNLFQSHFNWRSCWSFLLFSIHSLLFTDIPKPIVLFFYPIAFAAVAVRCTDLGK